MQPNIMQALHDWSLAWADHISTAQAAFTAAFPALDSVDDRCRCYGPTLRWEKAGEGLGKVCLDDHGRATAEFEKVPKTAVGRAMAKVWGPGWFNEGDEGFAEAEPGQYEYTDELSYAEFEFDVHDDGTVSFGLSYLKVEDLTVMLDALERALAAERTA